MRRLHLFTGSLGVLAFLITGQIMRHHAPTMKAVDPEVRMMYVSRHIYLLGAALVNLVLGLYLQQRTSGLRRTMHWIGSLLIISSPILLLLAFAAEPELGLAGRSWKSQIGLFALFGGAMIDSCSCGNSSTLGEACLIRVPSTKRHRRLTKFHFDFDEVKPKVLTGGARR